MKKTLEPYQLIERSIIKKYRKELWTPFIVAVKRYELVQAGDRIVAVGDKEVSSSSDITTALDDYSVGDQVKITITRGGKTGTATVTLAEQSHANADS